MSIKEVKKIRRINKTKFAIPILLLGLVFVLTFCVQDFSAATGDTIYVNGSSGNDTNNGATLNQSSGGEDGTINGFEAVGNVQYTNLVPFAIANMADPTQFVATGGGGTFSTYKNYTNEIMEMQIVADGSAGSQGLIVKKASAIPVGANTTYTFQLHICGPASAQVSVGLFDQNSVSFSGSVFHFTLDSTGNLFVSETITTKSDTTGILFDAFTATATALTFYISKPLLVQGTYTQELPWGYPNILTNTVTVENAISPSLLPVNQRRFAYCHGLTWVTSNTFVEMASKGITDVICYLGPNIVTDYATFKTNIQNMLNLAAGSGLKVHACYDKGTATQLSDSAYRANLATNLAQLVTDLPSLAGVSSDDYFWPVSGTDSTWTTTLTTLAQDITAAVHAKGNYESSAATGTWTNGNRGMNLSALSAVFDFIMPEVYRYTNTSSTFISDTLNPILALTGSNKVYPAILTFKADATWELWDVTTLKTDLNTILNLNPQGYTVYTYMHVPSDLRFPQRVQTPYKGTHCIMVQTAGITAGEGVNIPISAITANKSQYTSSLRVKAPLNVELTLKLGAGAIKNIIGTGDWQTVSDIQIPTDQKIYLVTSSATATTFYVDTLDETIT
ncbi:MAG: hypothetical protein K8E24_014635, partial [Methanobacterium paludis]|nr:hypothetical protein [Methanobacterium paludis]